MAINTTPSDSAKRPKAPPALRHLTWWFALPFLIIVVGAIFYQMPAVRNTLATPNLWIGIGIPVFCVAPLFIAMFFIWRGQQRIFTVVNATDGHACIYCVHNLSGLGDAGICPECGKSFDAVTDRELWINCRMLRLRKNP